MTPYQQALHDRAPEPNSLHMETVAYANARTLNGQPPEFFDAVAAFCRRVGSEKLAALHASATERLS